MKRFVSNVCFCFILLIFGAFVFLPESAAEKNVLESLLNLPAPPPPNPLIVNKRRIRQADFYNRNKIPPDDAPIEDLIAYWQSINQYNRKQTYAPTPSQKTFERLRDEITNDPELLPSLLNALPDSDEAVSFVKNLYDRELSEKNFDRGWRESIKSWLTYHSSYFSDELARKAQQASDANEYVTNQEEILALARVDWDKARPILERLLNDSNQPISQTLARWAFYNHAVAEKNSSDIEKYRKELQRTVENKNAKPGNRDLAMDALVEGGDFEGRDDWYFSLLEDETLHNLQVNGSTYTGLTTLLNHSPADKYKAKMLELLKSDNPNVKNAAVRNLATLLNEKNPEIVQALLPWLENPNWAKEISGERQQLVYALRDLHMPESVPGLIAVLNEKQLQPNSSNYSANTVVVMNTNASSTNNTMVATFESYPFRDAAIGALAAQKDNRAVAPLRAILPQVEFWQRAQVVRAMLNCGAFSVPEQVEALESVAKEYNQATDAGASNTNSLVNTNAYDVNGNTLSTVRPFNPSEIKPLLGMQLINQPDADEILVTALIERINFLDTKDVSLASALRKIIQNWNGAAVNRLLLNDLKNDKADTDSIVKLLSIRKQLRETQSNEVFDVRGGTPFALGIAACLIEDTSEYDRLLASENVETKAAMLACARLIRADLPVSKVAEYLKHPHKSLAQAAELYLISEDSPEARQAVLALHPNEALILGARTFFPAINSVKGTSNFLPVLFASVNESLPSESYYIYYSYFEDLIATEKKLQKEIKENQELLGVYAYDNNFVHIYKGKTVFSWQEDKARYRERDLSKEEFDRLKNFLTAENINDLPPFLSECSEECESKELLMLGRNGGRRIFTLSAPQPKFFKELESIFTEMRLPPAKLHYWLEKNITGLEILFENENLQAEAVWKSSEDFRVLINNAARRKEIDREIEQQEENEETSIEEPDYEKLEITRQKRREQREFENYSWQKIQDGKLAGLAEQPKGIEFIPPFDAAPIRATERQWKARASNFEIRTDSEGVYKISGGRATKIRDGYFDKPLISTNNRWLIANNYGEETGRQLVRINLLTNKQFPINFDALPLIEPVANIAPLNKILLFGSQYNEGEYEYEDDDVTQREGEFFILDAETGTIQKAKGEVRPLAQQTFRPLQPTGNADEFWAAIPDTKAEETQFGIYNARNLTFKSLMKIPQITFNSMQMWVDGGKLYFVYEGHLLSLPLPK